MRPTQRIHGVIQSGQRPLPCPSHCPLNWPAHCSLWKSRGGCGPTRPRMDSQGPLPIICNFSFIKQAQMRLIGGHWSHGYKQASEKQPSAPPHPWLRVLPSFPPTKSPLLSLSLAPTGHSIPGRGQLSTSGFWMTKELLCPILETNNKPGNIFLWFFNN